MAALFWFYALTDRFRYNIFGRFLIFAEENLTD